MQPDSTPSAAYNDGLPLSRRRGPCAACVSGGCPKCACEDLHVVFHKQGCSDDRCSCATCHYGSHAKEHREHLHVTCRRCQFDWVAPTLEQLEALRVAVA